MTDIEEMRKKVKKQLDAYRYRHTLGVMYTAASLAMKYEVDMEQAMTAGLLHDCAKCIADEKKIQMCRTYQIALTETELVNTALIHPKLGAYLAEAEYGIKDQEILRAIESHTTGRPKMSILEKILYIADYIEPGRSEAPNLALVRRLAFEDIDRALFQILDDTLCYLKDSGRLIDQMTEETHRFYKNLLEQEEI